MHLPTILTTLSPLTGALARFLPLTANNPTSATNRLPSKRSDEQQTETQGQPQDQPPLLLKFTTQLWPRVFYPCTTPTTCSPDPVPLDCTDPITAPSLWTKHTFPNPVWARDTAHSNPSPPSPPPNATVFIHPGNYCIRWLRLPDNPNGAYDGWALDDLWVVYGDELKYGEPEAKAKAETEAKEQGEGEGEGESGDDSPGPEHLFELLDWVGQVAERPRGLVNVPGDCEVVVGHTAQEEVGGLGGGPFRTAYCGWPRPGEEEGLRRRDDGDIFGDLVEIAGVVGEEENKEDRDSDRDRDLGQRKGKDGDEDVLGLIEMIGHMAEEVEEQEMEEGGEQGHGLWGAFKEAIKDVLDLPKEVLKKILIGLGLDKIKVSDMVTFFLRPFVGKGKDPKKVALEGIGKVLGWLKKIVGKGRKRDG